MSDYDGAKVQVLSTTGSLDAEGALWAGNETQVARVMGPSSGTGPRTLAPTRVVTYTTTGANDGGGMTFVPIPTGLGF